jgi:hypothetical protein
MNNENHLSIKQTFRKNDGIAFTGTAVVIAVLLAFVALFLRNHVSANITSTANLYSSTQAFWGAISGIDHLVETADFDVGVTDNTYDFSPTTVRVQTSFVDLAVDSTYLVTSKGTHGGHERNLMLYMKPPSPFDNTFFDIDSTDNWWYTHGYSCGTPGYQHRFWGSSCDTCATDTNTAHIPEFVLLPSYLPLKDPDDPSLGNICYWLGRKTQESGEMNFITIYDLGGVRGIKLSIWLAAGVDVETPVEDQDDFQVGDHLKFVVNGEVIEDFRPGGNNLPMTAIPGLYTDDPVIASQFKQFTLNISDFTGPVDSLSITIDGKTNHENKYLGFGGVMLSYDMDWIIDAGSIQEL